MATSTTPLPRAAKSSQASISWRRNQFTLIVAISACTSLWWRAVLTTPQIVRPRRRCRRRRRRPCTSSAAIPTWTILKTIKKLTVDCHADAVLPVLECSLLVVVVGPTLATPPVPVTIHSPIESDAPVTSPWLISRCIWEPRPPRKMRMVMRRVIPSRWKVVHDPPNWPWPLGRCHCRAVCWVASAASHLVSSKQVAVASIRRRRRRIFTTGKWLWTLVLTMMIRGMMISCWPLVTWWTPVTPSAPSAPCRRPVRTAATSTWII